MALPLLLRLCVRILAVLGLLWGALPGSRQKCVFDEVQAQVRLVRAAPFKPHGPLNESRTSREQPSGHQERTPPLREATRAIDSPQPIRIRTWVPVERDNQSEAEKQRLEAAVNEAVRTVSSLLSVNRVTGPLLLRRDINKYCKFLWRNSSSANYNRCGRANKNYRNETCLDVTIPDEHLEGCDIYPEADSSGRTTLRSEGAGLPDTDFLLYLHVRATDKCRAEPDVRAYAVHCQTDSHGRPVAGVVVFCRERLTGVVHNHQATVQTVIHELFHALGFSKELFHTWRDCSSSSPAQGCSLRAKMIGSDATGQVRIYTQSVASALREHLGSTDPDLGGPLENQDTGPGGLSSHWESRVMPGSIMAPVLGDPTTVQIDPVTLAALQDTGWYTVDLSRAQSLVWGKGEGSLFGSTSTCRNSSTFFCSGSGLGCHYLHLHKGQCQTDPYLDGCRFYKPFRSRSECWIKENVQQSAQEEIFGLESRCFFSNLTKQNSVGNSSMEGRCYRHRCTGLNQYQVQVYGSDWVDCPAGGAVQVKGHHGYVWCPDRRLCLPDVASLSLLSFLSLNTSDSNKTMTENGTEISSRTPAQLTVLTVILLLIVASASLPALVVTGSCRSCKVRVQSVQDEHNLQHSPP